MQVNPSAPVFQTKQIFIQASAKRVWAVLTDINQWPNWNKKISRALLKGKVEQGASFQWKVNGASIQSILHTVENERVLGWTGVTFGGSAIHNWHLEPQKDGTMVFVEESMDGWLIRLFKNKMNRDLAADMAFWLEKLKIESEA